MTRKLTTYLKLCTEFYDMDKPHDQTSQEYNFYRSYAQQAQGAILEPMCGTGRFLIPMLQAGYEIEGFDASPHMLEALKQKAAILHLNPRVWQEFIQDFTSQKMYMLIFIPFSSLGLITNKNELKQALAKMYKSIAPGGRFVFDIDTVASLPEPCGIWRRGSHTRKDGSRVIINTLTSYQPETQLFKSVCRYESVDNNQMIETETEDFQQYLFHYDEMEILLQNAGFSNIIKYQDYSKKPTLDQNTHLLIYECIK